MTKILSGIFLICVTLPFRSQAQYTDQDFVQSLKSQGYVERPLKEVEKTLLNWKPVSDYNREDPFALLGRLFILSYSAGLGVVSLGCEYKIMSDGTPYSPTGVKFRDGMVRPTYDVRLQHQ